MDDIQADTLKQPENIDLINDVLERELGKKVVFSIYGTKSTERDSGGLFDISEYINAEIETDEGG